MADAGRRRIVCGVANSISVDHGRRLEYQPESAVRSPRAYGETKGGCRRRTPPSHATSRAEPTSRHDLSLADLSRELHMPRFRSLHERRQPQPWKLEARRAHTRTGISVQRKPCRGKQTEGGCQRAAAPSSLSEYTTSDCCNGWRGLDSWD